MKRFTTLFLAIAFIISVPLISFASGTDQSLSVDVFSTASATSFVLMDGDTGDVLASRNADLPLPMASTTKIMTCIVALEHKALSDEVVVAKEAVGVEGSSVYLSKGEKLKLEELLYALMLESANDAAVAIACHVSGSIEAFVEEMNEKAKELGMSMTKFQNPHGLPSDTHYSTARDLCKLMQYCIENPVFCEMIGTKSCTISAPQGKIRYLSNHNKLLRLYEDCIGGKTGYTKAAGRCLVTAAEKEDKTLICATLGDPNDWQDHISLFDYGFSMYSRRVIVEQNSIKFQIPVISGTEDLLPVSNLQGLSLSLRNEETVSTRIELPRFVYAAVKQGDVIGEAVYFKGEEEIARIPLVAEVSVELSCEKLSFWERFWQTIKIWLK